MGQSIIIYTIAIAFFYMLAVAQSKKYMTSMRVGSLAATSNSLISLPFIGIIAFYSIFCGIRFDVGADYIPYLKNYLNFEIAGDLISGPYEIGFTYLTQICSTLNLSPMIYFGIIAFLQMTFLLLAFRKEQYLWPSLLLFFFANGGFMLMMNGLRQTLAMSIWMSSLYFLEERKFIYYLIFIIIASLFHSSAAFLILLYPLFNKYGLAFLKSIPIQYVIIIAAFIIRLAFHGVFLMLAEYYSAASGGMYDNYLEELDSYGNYTNTGLAFIYRNLIYLIIIAYSDKMRRYYNNTKRFDIIYAIFFIGVVCECIIPIDMAILFRPFVYFTFFDSIMFAFFVYYLGMSKQDNMLKIVLIISCLGIFTMNQIVSNEDAHVWYQFYFDNPSVERLL